MIGKEVYIYIQHTWQQTTRSRLLLITITITSLLLVCLMEGEGGGGRRTGTVADTLSYIYIYIQPPPHHHDLEVSKLAPKPPLPDRKPDSLNPISFLPTPPPTEPLSSTQPPYPLYTQASPLSQHHTTPHHKRNTHALCPKKTKK